MSKRGQITLFVIIAILIIAAVLVYFVIKPKFFAPGISKEEAAKVVAAQVQPVKDKVEGCMRIVVIKTLNTLGRQGGILPLATSSYFSQPIGVIENAPIMNYALFLNDESKYLNLFPSLHEMERSIERFLENNPDFMTCINNFEDFKSVDINFKEDYKFNVTLADKVYVEMKWPVTIKRSDASSIIEKYNLIIPINFEKIHENTIDIINRIIQTGEATSFLTEQAKQQIAELRANSETDTIAIQSFAYEDLPSALEGTQYDLHNTVWLFVYRNPALDEPYNFYFLTGER